MALFYPVENWRGKRAWEKCKRELQARGEALDWAAFTPPSVPDEQNFFKAPKMSAWFAGRNTNEFALRLDPERLHEALLRHRTNVVLDVAVVSPDEGVPTESADLVLRYDAPVLALVPAASTHAPDPRHVIIPLVQFEDVPLRSAITNLARQADLKYVLDPKLDFDNSDEPAPVVSGRWEDVTALQVLIRVLNQHNLQWIDDPKTGVGFVTSNPSGVPRVYVDPAARGQIGELVQKVLASRTNDFPGRSVVGPQGFAFVVKPIGPVTPARVAVQSRQPPRLKEARHFFPTNASASGTTAVGLRLESAGSHFRVLLSPPPYTAAEYLAWSGQFTPEFDAIRAAVKRPYARMDGDYQFPPAVPVPNYKTIRPVAQTLAQRALCHLLQDQPEQALRELTLLHDLCRMLKGKPTGRPMTLVAAMTAAEVVRIHANVVADGLRLRAWREPQLIALQLQCQNVNLPALLTEGLRADRAGNERTLEAAMATNAVARTQWKQRLKRFALGRWLPTPRGWCQQNLVRMALSEQKVIESFDMANRTVLMHNVKGYQRDKQKHSERYRPYTFLAGVIRPDFTRAVQAAARNQAVADQAVIACALERYRIAQGDHPDSLDALVPRFLDKPPHDIVNGKPMVYRRSSDGQFLLYSVGWNETDDGGATSQENGVADPQKGDCVWTTE